MKWEIVLYSKLYFKVKNMLNTYQCKNTIFLFHDDLSLRTQHPRITPIQKFCICWSKNKKVEKQKD